MRPDASAPMLRSGQVGAPTPGRRGYHGRYFEEFHKDQEFSLPPFSISQREVEEFGRLTGDQNPLHTDTEFSRTEGLFGRPVVHGMATLSFAMGVIDKAEVFRGTSKGIAVTRVQFRALVYPGYALWAKLTVHRVFNIPDKPYGLVDFDLVVEDARECVLEAAFGILVARRAAALKMGAGPEANEESHIKWIPGEVDGYLNLRGAYYQCTSCSRTASSSNKISHMVACPYLAERKCQRCHGSGQITAEALKYHSFISCPNCQP